MGSIGALFHSETPERHMAQGSQPQTASTVKEKIDGAEGKALQSTAERNFRETGEF